MLWEVALQPHPAAHDIVELTPTSRKTAMRMTNGFIA